MLVWLFGGRRGCRSRGTSVERERPFNGTERTSSRLSSFTSPSNLAPSSSADISWP